MLLVKTRLGQSPIHGIGLFANQFIPAGIETWRWEPAFDIERSKEEIDALPEHMREWFKQYAYLDFHVGSYLLCVDDARFINHSDDANVCTDYSLNRYGIDFATRDIQLGEEITINYRLIEKDNWLSGAR
jgi:SET domain-containing protein